MGPSLPIRPPVLDHLQRNLADVRRRIERARDGSPHAADHVDLVVVTKGLPPTVFPLLREAGVEDVGENRVQEALRRRPRAPEGLRWHGIGHLQRNKAAEAIQVFDVFHALDSGRLLERLAAVLTGPGRPWPVYLQVNAARDPAKGGPAPEEALGYVKQIVRQPRLHCRGFMTMAREGSDEAEARRSFRALREVRDEAVRLGLGDPPPGGLSMGMSDDFAWAVAEGATVVRVGRAIFEGTRLAASRGAAGPAWRST